MSGEGAEGASTAGSKDSSLALSCGPVRRIYLLVTEIKKDSWQATALTLFVYKVVQPGQQ